VIAVLKILNRNVTYDIVLATREDIPSIRDIDTHSLVSRVSEEWLHERHDQYKDRFFIAKQHGTGDIVGYLTAAHHLYYCDHLPGYVYISRFAIREDYRRRKVGTALLIALIEHLKGIGGYKGVVADVRKSNAVSLRFFESRFFIRHEVLSCQEWYQRGELPEDRHKIVLYHPFWVEDGNL